MTQPAGIARTPLEQLVREFRSAIGRDTNFNNGLEVFIAGCDPAKVDVHSLKLSLAGCREATARLAELYRLIEALIPHERMVYALTDNHQPQSNSGPSAAA